MKNKIIFTILFCIILSSCKKEGCTSPEAINFDSNADSDDGSCEFAPEAADFWIGNYTVNQTSQNTSVTSLPPVDSEYSIVISKVSETAVNIQNLVDCSNLSASVSETSMVPTNIDECDIHSILITKTESGFAFEISYGELDIYEVTGTAVIF